MKGLAPLVIVLLTGCGPATDPIHRERTTGENIPMEVIRKLPARLNYVKVGMDQKTAYELLGLGGYNLLGLGSGSLNSWEVDYRLRSNCILTVCLDQTKAPPRLASIHGVVDCPVVLQGDGWKEKDSR